MIKDEHENLSNQQKYTHCTFASGFSAMLDAVATRLFLLNTNEVIEAMLQQRLIPNGMHVASTSKAMQALRPAAAARLLRTALRWWKLQDESWRSLGGLDLPELLQQAACDLKLVDDG